MKVVCDACQAKYQIPDERVAGRKLKIRCRKCGGTILVRGDHNGDGNAAHSGHPTGVEWHVSLHGEQHGPYTQQQMIDMLHAGQLAWDAYVWREGYGDWRLAGDSDTLVRAVAGRVSAAQDEAPTSTTPSPYAPPPDASDDSPTRSLPSSPGLHAVDAEVARPAFGARAQARASQPVLAAVGSGLEVSPQAPQPFAAAAAVPQPVSYSSNPRLSAPASFLTGERHEDSVLFSARNLAASAAPAPVTASRPGYASAEGSGLIDIRALAALARGNSAAAAAQPIDPSQALPELRPSDELMTLAHQAGAFGKLDSLAPLDRASRTPSNAVPMAILAGSAMIAIAGVFAVYLLRPSATPQAVAVSAQPESAAAQPVMQPELAPEPAAKPPEPAAKPAEPKAALPETAPPVKESAGPSMTASGKPQKAAPALAPALAKRGGRPAPAAKAGAKAAAEPKAEPEAIPAAAAKGKKESAPSIDDLLADNKKPEQKPAAKPATPDDDLLAGPMPAPKATSSKSRSIDELLDDAVPEKGAAGGKKGAAAEASSAALPDTPSRDDVRTAMNAVTPAVKACADGQALDSPTANVALTVTGSAGRVAGARVTGVTGAVASCIAREVRNAVFPKFARAQLTINYPFKLK